MRFIGPILFFIGSVYIILIITLILSHNVKIKNTKQKINKIVALTEELERFKEEENKNYEDINVGDDAWGRPITMKFLNKEVFIVTSDGPDINDEADDIWKKGRISEY